MGYMVHVCVCVYVHTNGGRDQRDLYFDTPQRRRSANYKTIYFDLSKNEYAPVGFTRALRDNINIASYYVTRSTG